MVALFGQWREYLQVNPPVPLTQPLQVLRPGTGSSAAGGTEASSAEAAAEPRNRSLRSVRKAASSVSN